MFIKQSIMNIICEEVCNYNYEVGGILGSTINTNIIDRVYIDIGDRIDVPCKYKPDVDSMNQVIQRWMELDVEFQGIFHSHLHNVSTLSEGDCLYINQIMNAMPESVDCLYFPVVTNPQGLLYLYRAERYLKTIKIQKVRYDVIN